MATSQQHSTPRGPEGDGEGAPPVPTAPAASTQAVDDLLDEIDDVLETNAESFVRGFVQKGGQ
ncbi:ubiquitin-like protein Pup [Serinibacter arcticus]|uniref:Prokaryotic ubiquitin-like protein Pup n=1 Tax=Serinibacter arcticus TaxID=1655435 RepID=A0A2U1ZRH9_9MICO|nr:ubiquitin-like protein Pup [Serinibacter arcticus]PWD49587.1 ubiquitin-like protein Pup [Serinibacter arcticus]